MSALTIVLWISGTRHEATFMGRKLRWVPPTATTPFDVRWS